MHLVIDYLMANHFDYEAMKNPFDLFLAIQVLRSTVMQRPNRSFDQNMIHFVVYSMPNDVEYNSLESHPSPNFVWLPLLERLIPVADVVQLHLSY